MPSEIADVPQTSLAENEVIKGIMKRINVLEEDNLQLKMRCEDLEDENGHLRATVAAMDEKLCKMEAPKSESPEGAPHHARLSRAPSKRVSLSCAAKGELGSSPASASQPAVSKPELERSPLALLCFANKWSEILDYLKKNPSSVTESFPLKGNGSMSTALHQVIGGKGSPTVRADIINFMIETNPECARMGNSRGTLPLHAICQLNLDIPARLKKPLLLKLADAYPEALHMQAGYSQRTPLHMLLKDKSSIDILVAILKRGSEALKVRDNHGYLPIHVYCSTKSCQIGKLQIVCEAYPAAVLEKTSDGDTPLALLTRKGEQTNQPNYSCIVYLENKMVLEKRKLSVNGGNAPIENTATAASTAAAPATIHDTIDLTADGLAETVGKEDSPLLVSTTRSYKTTPSNSMPIQPSVSAVSPPQVTASHGRDTTDDAGESPSKRPREAEPYCDI